MLFRSEEGNTGEEGNAGEEGNTGEEGNSEASNDVTQDLDESSVYIEPTEKEIERKEEQTHEEKSKTTEDAEESVGSRVVPEAIDTAVLMEMSYRRQMFMQYGTVIREVTLGHIHTDDCYEWILVCEQEEHSHEDTCYEEPLAEEEVDGHIHTEACYEQILICEDEIHEHTEACYQQICIGEPEEHIHTEACYEQVLQCEDEDHEHLESCYKWVCTCEWATHEEEEDNEIGVEESIVGNGALSVHLDKDLEAGRLYEVAITLSLEEGMDASKLTGYYSVTIQSRQGNRQQEVYFRRDGPAHQVMATITDLNVEETILIQAIPIYGLDGEEVHYIQAQIEVQYQRSHSEDEQPLFNYTPSKQVWI